MSKFKFVPPPRYPVVPDQDAKLYQLAVHAAEHSGVNSIPVRVFLTQLRTQSEWAWELAVYSIATDVIGG